MTSIHKNNNKPSFYSMVDVEDRKEFLENIAFERDLKNQKAIETRAHSLTIGTAFAGTIEVGMRCYDSFMFAQLQPVEAIEVLYQLANACGVNIDVTPRNDFSSWRMWNEVDHTDLKFKEKKDRFFLEDKSLALGLSADNLQKQIDFLTKMRNIIEQESVSERNQQEEK